LARKGLAKMKDAILIVDDEPSVLSSLKKVRIP